MLQNFTDTARVSVIDQRTLPNYDSHGCRVRDAPISFPLLNVKLSHHHFIHKLFGVFSQTQSIVDAADYGEHIYDSV
jgi:hypothetical protein